MAIRAIYLPDLAFDPNKGNCIFEYDYTTKHFHMCIDRNFKYDLIAIMEDSNWKVFETESINLPGEPEYGVVKEISKEKLFNILGGK